MKSVPNLAQFHAAVEIIFPGARRGADGPLDYISEDFEFEEDEVDLLEV